MKLTMRLKRGRKTEWWVLQGGEVRSTIGEINREMTGGVVMQYRPYLHMRDKPGPDGEDYYLRSLQAKDTLEEAVEVIREKLSEPVEVAVTSRVSFVGVGMTADRAAKFANAMARKIAKEGLQ